MKNIKEIFIIFGTVTLVLLAIRLVVIQILPNNWVASFGIMMSISVLLLVLSKKGKLGWWGQMFLRQMTKNQKGKRAIFFYGQSIFLIAIMAGTIYAINLGNSPGLASDKHEMLTKVPQLQDNTKMMDDMKNTPPLELVTRIAIGLLFLPLVLIYEFPKIAIMVSAINDSYHGWILNLYTASLVEYLGIFGMMLFYRGVLVWKNPKYEI